tara:strand:- start:621 stop:1163 length:543 start_codon:yes stop_codon:yes gene_type:complete
MLKNALHYTLDCLLHLYYTAHAYQRKVVLKVDTNSQLLHIYQQQQLTHSLPISSAKNGLGETENSNKTPRGWHEITDYFGDQCDPNTYFISREPQGIYQPTTEITDLILGRILWLNGKQFANANTKQRYIYCHGTNEVEYLGKKPMSHGCIRMHPNDILTLFTLCYQEHLNGHITLMHIK